MRALPRSPLTVSPRLEPSSHRTMRSQRPSELNAVGDRAVERGSEYVRFAEVGVGEVAEGEGGVAHAGAEVRRAGHVGTLEVAVGGLGADEARVDSGDVFEVGPLNLRTGEVGAR